MTTEEKVMTRKTIQLTSAIALAAGLGFAATASAQEETVVGHLTYHTGEFGAFGPFFDGVAEVAIAKINQDPPLGRPWRAVHQDIGTVGEARAARKLVDSDGVHILLNPAHSYMSYREFMLETIAEQGYPIMPSVHGGAIDGSIGGVAEEPIFRGSPMDTAQGTAALLYAQQAGKNRVVIVGTETAGAQLQKNAALRTAEALGMDVLDDFDIQASDSNYRSVVSRIARLDPEAVVIFSSTNAGGSIVKNAAEAGESWFVVGPTDWQETEFIDTATESALAQHEEVAMAAFAHAENPAWEAYEPFANSSPNIEDIGDVANSYAIQYYDVMIATALAIEKAGEISSESWTEAMYDVTGGDGEIVYTYEDGLAAIRDGREINYDGVTGTMEYTPTGIVSGLFGIFEWQDGELVQIDSVDGDTVLEHESM
jgi:ABC-type branched-subunit amino acid transport system substrate-binding protein